MTGEDPAPAQGPPEFNPLRYPPCACPRHSPGPGPERDKDDAGDSALLRELRTRMNEENRLRRWARGQS
ncbi:hypothetical protein CLM85_23055 [Streptomyces albidoflavus]|uniref:hypothetical protein n=1 Tax=Streptomyces albidoflavus TaxID=1886 RepID=UPI000BAE4FD9|nr:hypothetical protein [Streptomyces albidoflavus]MBF4134345.1 hypothetical protein [Streptomyces albidoflavus]PAX84483.1 hypothetical protein CLM81_16485 [Streptomyces albidoflavus]PAX91402.1 hypothetical protein CLM82_09500 [Streptomyces albidoflavus]PBO18339.1 hypothetical protein CLM83_12895 [Streptomyces albidoflavus]PBO22253.1 hypothetical protein CLM85_23055 [Streptomyces albidoflavus]